MSKYVSADATFTLRVARVRFFRIPAQDCRSCAPRSSPLQLCTSDTVGAGRLTHDTMEQHGEVALRLETDIHRDLHQRHVGLTQENARACEPLGRDERMWRVTRCGPERTGEMERTQTDMRGKELDRQPLVEVRTYKRFHPCGHIVPQCRVAAGFAASPVEDHGEVRGNHCGDRMKIRIAQWRVGAERRPHRVANCAEEGIENAVTRQVLPATDAARVTCPLVDVRALDLQDREVARAPEQQDAGLPWWDQSDEWLAHRNGV